MTRKKRGSKTQREQSMIKKEILELDEEGYTIQEIANTITDMGYSPKYVSKMIKSTLCFRRYNEKY